MRTTLALDDELLEKAQAYTGLKEKSALVREALKALVERESARRLARLGGSAGVTGPASEAPRSGVILVDTSIWIDHLRAGHEVLSAMLDAGMVLMHPFVAGELALCALPERGGFLEVLADLPCSEVASHAEVAAFIEGHALYGRGVGYVDVHLLAAARLTAGCALWTADRQLRGVASSLGVAWGG